MKEKFHRKDKGQVFVVVVVCPCTKSEVKLVQRRTLNCPCGRPTTKITLRFG